MQKRHGIGPEGLDLHLAALANAIRDLHLDSIAVSFKDPDGDSAELVRRGIQHL